MLKRHLTPRRSLPPGWIDSGRALASLMALWLALVPAWIGAQPPLATPAVGASSAAAMFRGDAARTGSQPGPGPSGEPALRWRFQTGGPIDSSPAVVDGVVYAGSDDGNLYAVSAETGDERWRFTTGGAVDSSPAVANGLVYVGSADGILYAIDASSGDERWRFATGGPITSSPAVAGGLVYAGSLDGLLYALDTETGSERWHHRAGPHVQTSPAVWQGVVYIGGNDGLLWALDAATGEERWRFQTAGGLISSPAVVEDTVYIGGGGDEGDLLQAVDAASGTPRWSFVPAGALVASPAIARDLVIALGGHAILYAVEAETGVERWRAQLDGGERDEDEHGSLFHSSPAVTGDTLYVGAGDALCAVDTASGAVRWRIPVGEVINSSPAVVDGVVYAGGAGGSLFAFGSGRS